MTIGRSAVRTAVAAAVAAHGVSARVAGAVAPGGHGAAGGAVGGTAGSAIGSQIGRRFGPPIVGRLVGSVVGSKVGQRVGAIAERSAAGAAQRVVAKHLGRFVGNETAGRVAGVAMMAAGANPLTAGIRLQHAVVRTAHDAWRARSLAHDHGELAMKAHAAGDHAAAAYHLERQNQFATLHNRIASVLPNTQTVPLLGSSALDKAGHRIGRRAHR